jgi:NADH-quinone oxidoreductase subunit A
MPESYLPLLIVLILAVGLATVMLSLSNWLGPRRPSAIKMAPFECGNPAEGPVLDRFNVRFYLVAILFLVFDVEAVFIYPWALMFSGSVRGEGPQQPMVMALEMLSFVTILLVGLTYAWRKGALAWSQSNP